MASPMTSVDDTSNEGNSNGSNHRNTMPGEWRVSNVRYLVWAAPHGFQGVWAHSIRPEISLSNLLSSYHTSFQFTLSLLMFSTLVLKKGDVHFRLWHQKNLLLRLPSFFDHRFGGNKFHRRLSNILRSSQGAVIRSSLSWSFSVSLGCPCCLLVQMTNFYRNRDRGKLMPWYPSPYWSFMILSAHLLF
jgi:hypothetical protein